MRKIILYIFFLIFSIGAAAQNVLKGRVIDERTEEPIIGAAIQVKGTKGATVTDLNGHFSVSLEGSSPYTLVVTCLGYIQQDLEVYDAASDVDILMRENSRMLNEVVVVGYGTAKARDVISSISSINKDKLEGVLSVLPAMKKPAVSPLADSDWVDLITVVDESAVRSLIPELKREGASGIIEFPISKIID